MFAYGKLISLHMYELTIQQFTYRFQLQDLEPTRVESPPPDLDAPYRNVNIKSTPECNFEALHRVAIHVNLTISLKYSSFPVYEEANCTRYIILR